MLRMFQILNVASRSRSLTTFGRYHSHVLSRSQLPISKPLLWGSVFAFAASSLYSTVYLDSENESNETLVDPSTSIPFPTTLQLPSKVPLPTFTLVGVGVRTVSFLGIKVYSVGFYADLQSPKLHISRSATADEKIEHIIRNSACVIRIVPTRSTSYSHLRDGFMRSMQARLVACRQRGTLSADDEQSVQSPLRQLKSIFPSATLTKHTPLDILLTAPPSDPTQSRSLIIRDMGCVENDWVATEFVLAYFEGDGPSPPLKKSVVNRLESFGHALESLR